MHRVGIDLVEVARFERILGERQALQEEVFTEGELRSSLRHKTLFQWLASCFAAKEAFFKALGTGLSGEMEWRDVEVHRDPSGKTVLRLHGETSRVARDMGVVGFKFCFARAGGYVLAAVVIEMLE